MNLIPIKDEAALIAADIHYKPDTLYVYHHLRRWPGVFVKQGGKVLINIKKFKEAVNR